MPKLKAGFFPYLFFASAVIFLFHETIFSGLAFVGGRDRLLYEIPLLSLAAQSIESGRLPFWNPHIFCGTPALGDAVLRFFNPFNLLLLKFFPREIPWATSWRLIVELFLMMVFAYRFFFKVWRDPALALFSCLAYSLSTASVMQANYGNPLGGFTWFPLVLSILWDWPARPLRANLVWLSLSMAVQMASGFHQWNAYLWIFAAAMACARRFSGADGAAKTAARWTPFLCLGAGAAVFACLINAPDLWLFLDARSYSLRLPVSSQEYASRFLQPAWMLVRLVFPAFPGSFSDFPEVEHNPNVDFYDAFPAYAGAGSFLLALAALLRLKKPWVAAFASAAVLVALSSLRTPLWPLPYWLFGAAPLSHGRLAVLMPLCLAFLAPYGLKLFIDGGAPFRRRVIALCAGCVLILCLGASAVPAQRMMEASILFFIFSVPLLGALILHARGWMRAEHLKWFCGILLCADLLFFARFKTLCTVFLEGERWYPPSPVTDFLRNSQERFSHHTQIDFAVQWSRMPHFPEGFHPNAHMPYGVLDINGFSNFIDRRYAALFSVSEPSTRVLGRFPASTPALADLLAVKYFVVPAARDAALRYSFFTRPAFAYGYTRILSKPDAPARMRPVCRVKRVSGVEEIRQGAPALTVFADPVERFERDWSDCPKGFFARLAAHEETGGVWKAEIESRWPSLLLLTQIWRPGWKVFMDNAELPVRRVNYAFQAVELPAGFHRLRWIYEPPGFRASCLVSAFTLLALLSLGVSLKFSSKRQ